MAEPSPCLGQCDRAPAALLVESGEDPARARADRRRRRGAARGDGRRHASAAALDRASQSGQPGLRLLGGSVWSIPESLDDYRAHGGYDALRRAFELGPEGVLREMLDSKLHGPRRRRLSDRAQVGGGRPPAAPPALPDLQRRRVGAWDLQGPRDPRGRSVLADRVDDDRRVRDRLRVRLHLPARRVSARAAPAGERRSAGRGREAFWATTSSGTASASTSSCARAPARTSAARRPRSSARSRATAASRATSRRSRWIEGCSASRPSSTTSRRWSTCLPIVLEGGPAFAAHRHRALHRAEAVLRLRGGGAARHLRGAVRNHAARDCSSWPAA